MSAYRGHLTTVVGDGPEVVIKLSGHTVRVMTPDGRVHTWPSEDVRVTGISGDRFWLAFKGEIAVFAPEEPQAFMLEFLPGLKAARTVAGALAAVQPDAAVVEDESPEPASEPDRPAPPPRGVAAHKPRLPQLADHVESSMNGSAHLHAEEELTATPDLPPDGHSSLERRRWWSRHQTPPPIADSPEEINVDLTDESLAATLSAAIAETEGLQSEPDDPVHSDLLRKLADRKSAFDAEHRGTYQPRR